MDASDVAGQALDLQESAGEVTRIPMFLANSGGDGRYGGYAGEGRASHSVPLAEQLAGLGLPTSKWAKNWV